MGVSATGGTAHRLQTPSLAGATPNTELYKQAAKPSLESTDMKAHREPLHDTPVNVRVKLAAAWAAFTLVYVYVDYFNLYKPGFMEGILSGKVWLFDISEGFFLFALVSVSIPALMAVLSVALPATVTRRTNLIVAALYVPYSMFGIASGDWVYFHGYGLAAELGLLIFIIRNAWTWPRRDERIHPTS